MAAMDAASTLTFLEARSFFTGTVVAAAGAVVAVAAVESEAAAAATSFVLFLDPVFLDAVVAVAVVASTAASTVKVATFFLAPACFVDDAASFANDRLAVDGAAVTAGAATAATAAASGEAAGEDSDAVLDIVRVGVGRKAGSKCEALKPCLKKYLGKAVYRPAALHAFGRPSGSLPDNDPRDAPRRHAMVKIGQSTCNPHTRNHHNVLAWRSVR
jgi:hypothetical protein